MTRRVGRVVNPRHSLEIHEGQGFPQLLEYRDTIEEGEGVQNITRNPYIQSNVSLIIGLLFSFLPLGLDNVFISNSTVS